MDGLEERPDCDTLAAAQILTQFRHHPLLFGENDIDRDGVICFGNSRCSITAGCLNSKPYQLPRRRHSIHYRQQSVQEQLTIARGGTFDQLLAFFELSIGEVTDLQR